MGQVLNLAFYRFTPIPNLVATRRQIREYAHTLPIRGTLLLAEEGLNGFVAGEPEVVRGFMRYLEATLGIPQLEAKESWSEAVPFQKMKVKLKKEIISMGREDIKPAQLTGKRLLPTELRDWIREGKPHVILDTRNDYEVERGMFQGSKKLSIDHFRQFPEKWAAVKEQYRDTPVVMVCTGGIRCEKATALAASEGFDNVFQLEGGILKYFEDCGSEGYVGGCYVFDERKVLDEKLEPAAPVASHQIS